MEWVKVNYKEELLYGGERESDEKYSRCSTEYYNSEPLSLELVSSEGYGNHFKIDVGAERGYLVWQKYGDGSTFTSSVGEFHPIAIFNNEDEAYTLKEYFEKADNNEIGIDTKGYYLRGLDYFGSVQGYYVTRLKVKR